MLTIDQKTKLLKMWEDGSTSGQIASELRVTRNTVAGILGRMRAAGKVGYKDPTKNKTKPKPPKVVVAKPEPLPKPKVEIELVAVIEVVPPPMPQPLNGGKGIDLYRLNYRTCRYIISGEGAAESTFYCGHEISRGAYCEPHAAMCYAGREKILRPKNDLTNQPSIALRHAQRESPMPLSSRLWR